MEYYKQIDTFLKENIKKQHIQLIDWTIIDKPPFEEFKITNPKLSSEHLGLENDSSEVFYIECLLKDSIRNDYKVVRHGIIIYPYGPEHCEIEFSGELLTPSLHPFVLDDYIFTKCPEYEIYCKLLPDIYLKQSWRKLKGKFGLTLF